MMDSLRVKRTKRSAVRARKAARNKIKALSVRQPWAHAILYLGKDVENRSKPTHVREGILIQASLRMERPELDAAAKLGLDPGKLVRGVVVGSVRIVGCVKNAKSRWAIRGPMALDS
jgi:hypothetical protein